MSIISSFRSIEIKYDICRGKDSMKQFCQSLREQGMKITNFKKSKKMQLLTKELQESYENEQMCYICNKKMETKYLKNKKYCKVRDHYHYTGEYTDAVHNI